MPSQITPNFESIATPGAIVRQLEGRTMAELAALFRRAETATVRGWLLMSLIVGVALSKSRYGDRAAQRLAEDFHCSERSIHRLGGLFNDLIQPRITFEGDRARFPLAEQAYYTLAIQGASVAQKAPLELLAEAEAAKERDPRFTAGAFRRRIYGESSERTGREPQFVTLARKLAAVKINAAALGAVDVAELDALLDAATAKLADARRSLRRPRAA